jgi:predicted histone-like DNA-binding protein
MELEDLAKEISGRSSLTEGDILNVLANFVDVLPTFMREGYSVRLGKLGMVRLTLRSASTPTEEAFTSNHIRAVKIVFRPGKRLEEAVGKKLHFERVGGNR